MLHQSALAAPSLTQAPHPLHPPRAPHPQELYAAFGGHPPPKGLPQDVIAALPSQALTAAALPGLHSPTCAVCLEAFAPGDTARLLPGCPHCFHAACVDPWLAAKALCPVCRTPVQPPAAGKGGGGEAGAAAGAP